MGKGNRPLPVDLFKGLNDPLILEDLQLLLLEVLLQEGVELLPRLFHACPAVAVRGESKGVLVLAAELTLPDLYQDIRLA